jgi:hypothetical protein
MIAVVMHALPSSPGLPAFRSALLRIYYTRACRHWWQNSHRGLQMSHPRALPPPMINEFPTMWPICNRRDVDMEGEWLSVGFGSEKIAA